VAVKIKSKKRVFYRVSYENAIRMVIDRTAGIVNSTLIHEFNIRGIILERDGFICKYCGGIGNTIDHIIPKSKGGVTTFTNCVCACERCNRKKGSLSLREFMNTENKNLDPFDKMIKGTVGDDSVLVKKDQEETNPMKNKEAIEYISHVMDVVGGTQKPVK
jgi:hypothetical protein